MELPEGGMTLWICRDSHMKQDLDDLSTPCTMQDSECKCTSDNLPCDQRKATLNWEEEG